MKIFLSIIATSLGPSVAFAADISGDWKIESNVGATPIEVNCTLVQSANVLSGTCTPVMENAEPAELVGSVNESSAKWDYDVVFNGNPGHVGFVADILSDRVMSGTLLLSGNPSPFTATKQASVAPSRK